MADVKIEYGSELTFTCTLASLASSATAGREATVIDNSSNKFLDALVMVQAKLQTGTPANDRAIHVFAYGTVDTAGPTYPDKVTGTDAAITMDNPTNLQPLGDIWATAAGALTWKGGPWSVAKCFGGSLPKKWGIVIQNYTGVTLSATEGDHKKLYIPIYSTVI